jgi:hypothetical protein
MNDRSWPRRFHENGDDRLLRDLDWACSIMDRLEKLERETRPSGGDETSKDKDLKSREAIFWAGCLMRVFAGWAIDHQQGLAMAGRKSAGAPTSKMMDNPQFVEEKARRDSHENERAAIEIDHSFDRLSAEQQRRFSSQVAEFLKNEVFPSSLAEGLCALEFGEALPIVKKAKVEREKRNYTERTMQLQALKYIEYERGKGSPVGEARETVSSHFGVDTEAIRKWDGPLRKSLGDSYVSRELTRAFEDGEMVTRFKRHPNAAEFDFLHERSAFPTMTQAGKRFKQSLKDKKK